MNSRTMLFPVLLITVGVSVSQGAPPNESAGADQIVTRGVYKFPKRTLAVDFDDVVARRRTEGKWQACRIERFVWQEPLGVPRAKANTEPRRALETILSVDGVAVHDRGIFVVIKVAPQLYEKANAIKTDDALFKAFDKSDEVLIDIRDLKEPEFVIVKRANVRKQAAGEPTTAQAKLSLKPNRVLVAASAEEARKAFGSKSELQKLLRRRWPLSAVRAYCIPERRFNPLFQNLVCDGDAKWEGVLYTAKDTGLGEVDWYAVVVNGRVEAYSLNASHGERDNWLLEIGNERSVQEEPDYEPDWHHPPFINQR